MAELFNVKVNTINYHLKEILNSDELNEKTVIRKIRTTASDGKIFETDVVIANNYLSEEEIRELNNLVSMYLDFAERQVKLGHIISMKESKEKLEMFLNLNEYKILKETLK